MERSGSGRVLSNSPSLSLPALAHLRTATIIFKLFPFALSFVRDWRRWIFFGTGVRRSTAFHARRAQRLVAAIVELGPTFVKLAQVFASRPDVVPEPYLTALGSLTDDVPSAPVDSIRRTLQVSYGRNPDEIFDNLSREPLAAGSLAQVYRARYEGRDVVVKVLRPGVATLVERDIKAVRRLVAFASARWPNPHLSGLQVVVEQFALTIREEMDFRLEAANAVAIAGRFAGSRHVRIPAIEPALVREHVLVMEYMPGTRIDSLAPLIMEGRFRAEQVIEMVLDAYVQMMLVDGLFHADPHPGNLRIAEDGALIFLDFGMVARVNPATRGHLVRTALAAISRDADGVVRGFHDLGIVRPGADMTTIRNLVEAILAMAFEGVASADMAARVLTDRTLADDVMRTLYDSPIVLTGEMVYFGRAVSLIEGIGARYLPGFNAVQFAAPAILRHRRAVLAAIAGDADRGGSGASLATLIGDIARAVASATRQFAVAVAARVPGVALFSELVTTLYDESALGPVVQKHARTARSIRRVLSA